MSELNRPKGTPRWVWQKKVNKAKIEEEANRPKVTNTWNSINISTAIFMLVPVVFIALIIWLFISTRDEPIQIDNSQYPDICDTRNAYCP